MAADGFRVFIAFEQRAEAERAVFAAPGATGGWCRRTMISVEAGVSFLPLSLRGHFVIPDVKLAVLSDALLFPRRHKAAVARPSVGVELSSFRDLRKGDFVVHEDHGVGRFEGISTKTVAGVTRDYLDLAYRDTDMLYVPHDQISKVMRYVGAGGTAPALSKLGGAAWDNLKSRVRKAARQVAGELLQLYALRQASRGHEFSEDGEWQQRFEQAFPYDETEDQLRAIDVIKDDMESTRPMDRLLCGDVGYGKTEVALRAAFKASMDGKQVMVLVPTTILAQQHYGTFRERFADFPVKVEMVSRFRSAAEQKRILADFAAGKVDMLIGTHRLLSHGRQAQGPGPGDSGRRAALRSGAEGGAAADEGQGGRAHSHSHPHPAHPADVSQSACATSASSRRRPATAILSRPTWACTTRAWSRGPSSARCERGGQVFYLHNRVETIDKAAARCAPSCPRCASRWLTGRCPSRSWSRSCWSSCAVTPTCWSAPPSSRAGWTSPTPTRSSSSAPTCSVWPSSTRSGAASDAPTGWPTPSCSTRTKRCSPKRRSARLSTLADYTELGSGFKIAMRDLEIRGAGELLGDEQSGHIAAVGFEMYLSMLREATAELQGEGTEVEKMPRVDVGIDAHVPADFIGYEAARVDLHRRIASAKKLDDLAQVRAELTDRFGEIPGPVDNLVFLGEVRIILQALGADSLSVRPGKVTVTGLPLPAGSRERLRQRDRRYVYAPLQGLLSLGNKGEQGSPREAAQGVLDDILALFEADEMPGQSK